MKQNISITIGIIFLSFTLNGAVSPGNEFFLGVKYNSATEKNEIYKINQKTGVSTMVKDFAFPSGYWQPSSSFMDSYNGNLFLKDSNGTYMSYNPETNELTTLANVDNDFQTVFQTPWQGRDLIYKNAADGSTHIGENSLVTVERNGVQQLYATDAGGNKINIDITNGSDLLVNGKSLTAGIASTVAMSHIDIADEGFSIGIGAGSFAGKKRAAIGVGFGGNYDDKFSYKFKATSSDNVYGAGITFRY